MTDPDHDLEVVKERGHDRLAPIDAAYERGEITQTHWHDRVRAVVEPAYLAAPTTPMGSGYSGTLGSCATCSHTSWLTAGA